MRNRKAALLVALAILLSPLVAPAQRGPKKKPVAAARAGASSGTEPLRVINGEMRGRMVTGKFKGGARPTDFSFTITKADLVNGRLQLRGDFALGGARDQVTATIAGIISSAANPWPSPGDQEPKDSKKSKEEEKKAGEQQQGREAKDPEAAGQLGQLAQSTQDTARKTPPAPGEKTEQTQSLYAQAETDTGCGVMFFSLTLPQGLRARMGSVAEPLQLGVVLKPFDNELGAEINRQICWLLKRPESRAQSASLDQLNRLLVSSK